MDTNESKIVTEGQHVAYRISEEFDCNVLCEQRSGKRGLDGGADQNSIFIGRIPNNSKLVVPGHLSPVKVVTSLDARQTIHPSLF